MLDQEITRRAPCRVAQALSYAAGSRPARNCSEDLAESRRLLGRRKQVPDLLSDRLDGGVSGGSFTRAIEADDSTAGVEHQHQGADRVHHRGGEVALFLERLFGALKVA